MVAIRKNSAIDFESSGNVQIPEISKNSGIPKFRNSEMVNKISEYRNSGILFLHRYSEFRKIFTIPKFRHSEVKQKFRNSEEKKKFRKIKIPGFNQNSENLRIPELF